MSIYERQIQNANRITNNNIKLPMYFDLYKTLAAYNSNIKMKDVTLRQRENAKLSLLKGQFDSTFKFPSLIVLLEYYNNNKED